MVKRFPFTNKTAPITIQALAAELQRLMAPGILGYYNCCEVTEVIVTGVAKQPINVFSIIAFEESSQQPIKPHFLNPKHIELSHLKGWKFGIYRYAATPERLLETLNCFGRGNGWDLGGQPIGVGKLVPTRRQFIPPDASQNCALNRVLKNNFWNGSHVFELFDNGKELLLSLIERPDLILLLSEAIQAFIPLRLASLSDRLGNIIIQLPVRVVMTRFGFIDDQGMKAALSWDTRTQRRSCRLISSMEFDNAILGFGVSEAQGDVAEAVTNDSSRMNRSVLWDEEEHLLLAASGAVAAFGRIHLQPHIINPEPRIVAIPSKDSPPEVHRVQIASLSHESIVGDADPFEYRQWTDRRIYDEERKRLESDRVFVQYGLNADKKKSRHQALDDLRFLINKHGKQGAWLWDPYLTYEDIMLTMFFCEYHGVRLRALACKKPKKISFEDWRKEQQQGFLSTGNNHYGLNLEFRLRCGNAGWAFHDRFLIFPKTPQGPLAWSLGTSVNNFGAEHHILQKVDNGQMIVDAFQSLWDALTGDDYLVWRTP